MSIEHDEEAIERLLITGVGSKSLMRHRLREYHQHMSRWISVDEKLPPEGEIVLLAHGEGRCKAGYLWYECGKSQPPEYYGVDATNILFEVHHWRVIGDIPNSKIN